MAQSSLTYRVSVRWPWLYAALYIVGLRDLGFRLCVRLDSIPTKKQFDVGTSLERAQVARRIYPAHGPDAVLGYSAQRRAEMAAALSAREQAMLQQWEHENPRPEHGRDWARFPEDDYE